MTTRDRRALLIKILERMDDEAFNWLALAMLDSAMLHGAHAQVWPDGLGGFTDAANITAARQEARAYLGMKP